MGTGLRDDALRRRYAALVVEVGSARLRAALALTPLQQKTEALKILAEEFIGTSVEGRALMEWAGILQGNGEREQASSIYKKVVDTLVNPENEDVVRQSKAALLRYRKEDVQRRLEEMDRRKKEEEQKK